MRIVLLAPANSIHTVKIANGLVDKGHHLHVISLRKHADQDQALHQNAQVSYLEKNSYFFQKKAIQELVDFSAVDIVYAHYATGYGLVARQLNFHPTALALWGSDIFAFPKKSPVHRWFLKRNLAFPDALFSTSHVMAQEAGQYTHKKCKITPFGVDLSAFQPNSSSRAQKDPLESPSETSVCIGSMKALQPVYGMDLLIEAFHRLQTAHPSIKMTLKLYGEGEQKQELLALCQSLQVQNVEFCGRIPHEKVPEALQQFSLFCQPSREESFGVAALEAMACKIPCIVSDAVGLREVSEDGTYASMVPRNDVDALFHAMEDLLLDQDKAQRLGEKGYAHVHETYDWTKNLGTIEQYLQEVIHSRS